MPQKRPPLSITMSIAAVGNVGTSDASCARILSPPPGTPQFDVAYAAALAANAAVRRPDKRQATGEHDTVAGLIDASYMKVGSYRGLRQTSKTSYFTRLETMRRDHGHRSVSGMTPEGINKHILAPLADRPGIKLDTLKSSAS